jgi:ABC-type polysaccharide/polyol phosphate export permease
MSRAAYLVRELVVRDLRGRYTGSALGFLWAFVHPIWQLILFSVVFAIILRIPLVGERTESFAAFLFAGLLPWLAFSEGVTRSAGVVGENGQLVKKMRFPSQVLVYSVVISALIHAGIAFVLFCGLQAWRREIDLSHLPWLAVGVVGQIALTLGLGLIVAALQVYLRDVGHGLGLVLSALFYVTPIVYPIALVPDRLRGLLGANPLTTVVGLYRSFLISGDPPGAAQIVALAVWGAALLLVGSAVFRRLAPGFADEL